MGRSLRVTSVRDLGRVVLAARKQHGWTQAELAGRAAVGRSAVQKLESAWGTVKRFCQDLWKCLPAGQLRFTRLCPPWPAE